MKKILSVTLCSSFLFGALALAVAAKPAAPAYKESTADVMNEVAGMKKQAVRRVVGDSTTAVSKTYTQYGVYEGKYVVRFATAVKGDLESVSYFRSIAGGEVVEKAVSEVYKGIAAEDKVYYYDGNDLTEDASVAGQYYWACYTIAFSDESKWDTKVSAYLSVKAKDVEAPVVTVAKETSVNQELESASVAVSSIEISAPAAQVEKGKSIAMSAVVLPENATDSSLVWHSSDEKIATVDAEGKVTGVKYGDVEIYAVNEASGVESNRVAIKVMEYVPDNMIGQRFFGEVMDYYSSEFYNLTITVIDRNQANVVIGDVVNDVFTYNQTKDDLGYFFFENDGGESFGIRWESGYEGSKLLFTGGSFDGGSMYVEETTLSKYVAVKSITISANKTKVLVGEKVDISTEVNPSNATNKGKFKRVISDPSLAHFEDPNDYYSDLVADAPGTIVVTYVDEESGVVSNEVTITIEAPASATELVISGPNSVVEGTDIKLEAKLEGANNYSLSWSSSNKNVATVNSAGRVTGKAAGIVTITCKDSISGLSQDYVVTVVSAEEALNGGALIGTWSGADASYGMELSVVIAKDGLYITHMYGDTPTIALISYDNDAKVYVFAGDDGSTHLEITVVYLEDGTIEVTASPECVDYLDANYGLVNHTICTK